MSDVFLCKKGSLSQQSVRDLRKAGVIVVQADDPAECQFVRAQQMVSCDDMLWAALKALNSRGGEYGSNGREQREHFTKTMLEIVEASLSRHGSVVKQLISAQIAGEQKQ